MEHIEEKSIITQRFCQPPLQRITVEEAVELMTGLAARVQDQESVLLTQSLGRILSRDITAEFDNPPFPRSAIDGYACRWEDTRGALEGAPVYLKVKGEIDAGHSARIQVKSGEAVRIMTGAPVPQGCDCCIRQEDTDYGETTVEIRRAAKCWENYCFQGEDFKKGSLMLPAGRKLGYVEIGILASLGRRNVPVVRRPSVAIVTTGDEVVLPGEPLGEGKIYNSNLFLLNARMMEFGITPFRTKVVADDPVKLAKTLTELTGRADLIITTGGVSVGKKDIVHEALGIAGADQIFWRVQLKPGTPTIFSMLDQAPVVSLSGNPFGALANFELLIRPVLAKMSGDPSLLPKRREAVMADPFPKASPGRRFIRGIYEDGYVHMPRGLHSSGVLASMEGCNCMVDIEAGTMELKAGDRVNVVVL